MIRNASFADVRVWMFCHNMDWLFQNLHIWREDDAVFSQSSLWLHELRVVVFGLVSAEMTENGISTNSLQLISYTARLRSPPIIWDYRHGTRWKSDDLPRRALPMKWAVNKRPHLSESIKIAVNSLSGSTNHSAVFLCTSANLGFFGFFCFF